jgi:hypothetical protein
MFVAVKLFWLSTYNALKCNFFCKTLFKLVMEPERHVEVSVHASELHNQLSQFLRKALADHLTNEPDQPFVIGYSGEFYSI